VRWQVSGIPVRRLISGLCYNSGVGTLYLVATPIGNLEDITQRAIRTLRDVACIAAEDTRHTRKLLEHYQIETPLISYHEHSKRTRIDRLLAELEAGDVALVSDAGTPGLSDPGYRLVRAALDAGHTVSPIPGPAAPIAALSVSGLPTDEYIYLGYLPRKASERRTVLESLAGERRTLIFFEVPHRLQSALADMIAVFGSERPAAVCRELTKIHEEVLRGSLQKMQEHFAEVEPRGEFTLVISGAPKGERWATTKVRVEAARRLAGGSSPSQAAREIALESGWLRREVYELIMEEK
jgi:16S rRNA (cytidine1402-2'-O)-methyltransferase